jgi:hypothetical protein
MVFIFHGPPALPVAENNYGCPLIRIGYVVGMDNPKSARKHDQQAGNPDHAAAPHNGVMSQ